MIKPLIEIINSFQNIEELTKVKFPIKASFQLTRLYKKLLPEVQSFHIKKNELFKELGEQNGEMWNIKPENQESFIKQIKELGDVEIEFDFTPLRISELGDVQIEAEKLVDWIFK